MFTMRLFSNEGYQNIKYYTKCEQHNVLKMQCAVHDLQSYPNPGLTKYIILLPYVQSNTVITDTLGTAIWCP